MTKLSHYLIQFIKIIFFYKSSINVLHGNILGFFYSKLLMDKKLTGLTMLMNKLDCG